MELEILACPRMVSHRRLHLPAAIGFAFHCLLGGIGKSFQNVWVAPWQSAERRLEVKREILDTTRRAGRLAVIFNKYCVDQTDEHIDLDALEDAVRHPACAATLLGGGVCVWVGGGADAVCRKGCKSLAH